MRIKTSQPKNTPYQRLKNSKVGRLVRDNKVGTGISVAASSAVIGGAAFQSDFFASVAEKAIVPAVGATIAGVGATAVHDAFVNDLGKNNLKATAKIGVASAATLGGLEIVGSSFDIPVMDKALTGLVFDHGAAVVGTGLVGGAVLAGRFAAQQVGKMKTSDNKAVSAAVATGAAAVGAAAGLGGAQLIGQDLGIPVLDEAFTNTVEFLSQSPAASVVGGGLLVGGAVVAGTQSAKKLASNGNDYASAALGLGAAAGGLGGVELMGHGLGLEATEGLFTDNAELIGSLGVAAFGGAIARHAGRKLKSDGLSAGRAHGLTAGATMAAAGLAYAGDSLLGFDAYNVGFNTAKVVAGAGLGLAAVAHGKEAVAAAKEGKFGNALFHGAGAAASGAGSLYGIGSGLGIPGLETASEVVLDATVRPLGEHVVGPAFEFLFENPAIGGIGVALAVGGFAYRALKAQKD